VLENTSEYAVDEGSRLKEVWSPEVLLNVAMLVFVGIPVLQLPAVPQRLEDVLVQMSVVCARAKFVRIAAIPSATNLRAFLEFIVLLIS
jgi:hypothetical protein